MDQQLLKQYLDQLNEAIDSLDAATGDINQLQQLMDDIELQFSSPVVQGDPQSLVEQVDTMVSVYEADHPAVATILNNIIVTLTSMGV